MVSNRLSLAAPIQGTEICGRSFSPIDFILVENRVGGRLCSLPTARIHF
jgi:hypothetical protein